MKQIKRPRNSAPRHGTLIGLLLLVFSCALMGGAGPIDLINAASDAKDNLDAASLEGRELAPMEQPAPAPEVVAPAAAETTAAATPEAVAPAAPQEVDFVDFAEGEAEAATQMTTRTVDGVELITVSLKDATLQDTVSLFSQQVGANIIGADSLLTNRVTFNLRDVEWLSALRAILAVHQLDLREQPPNSKVYSIQAPVTNAPEPLYVETFFLDFTTVDQLQSTLVGIVGSSNNVLPMASRNAIVVRSTESRLAEVRSLIKTLDKPGRQVLIETKIMELSDDAVKQLGIDWSILAGYKVGLTDMEWQMSETRQRDNLNRDRAVGYNLQGTQAGRMDFKDQDGEEVSAATYDTWGSQPGFGTFETSSDTESGWQSTPSVLTEQDWEGTPSTYWVSQRASGSGAESLAERISNKMYDDIKTAILSPADLSVVLSALETMDGVSVVSNPKMIVTSGATNSFFSIGRRDPIVSSELKKGTTDSPGDTITSKLDTGIKTDFIDGGYLRTGIDLDVIATVKTDDYIEAFINPSLRRLLEFKEVGVNSWPIISLKEIGTTFTLRSGQTVAIGGLTDVQDQKVTKRVPVLGSLPIIGRLFSHEKTVKSQVETIIFVTLSVADPGVLEENAGIPEDARLVHQRRVKERADQKKFAEEFKKQVEAQAAQDAKDAEAIAPVVAPEIAQATVAPEAATEPVPVESSVAPAAPVEAVPEPGLVAAPEAKLEEVAVEAPPEAALEEEKAAPAKRFRKKSK
ncbi:MAG TPA: hypothetical protein DCM68_01755 [Verrucomicrobia bacterium]|nr:hypothetical protein [Verrucomicrobiota bacterium]